MSCTFNEDDYRDQQLDKYLDEQEMKEAVSNCCGATILENTDVCSDCKEHCSEIAFGEYMYDRREDAECDRADVEREMEDGI